MLEALIPVITFAACLAIWAGLTMIVLGWAGKHVKTKRKPLWRS